MSERVSVVTCGWDNVDPDSPVLLEALDTVGLSADLVVWDDPAVDWDSYSLNVIRSTWDYVDKYREFASWVASTPRIANDAATVAFSLDKHYLGTLADRGIPVIATSFVDVGSEYELPDGDFVIKPAIGAGSRSAERYSRDAHARASEHISALHEAGRDVLVQPYVHSVDTDGELACIFVDGEFTHAMRKSAMLNVAELDRHVLFRAEQMARVDAAPSALSTAREVLDVAGFDAVLYARVDLVNERGEWHLMELELAEPSLYLSFAPEAVQALALAIARRARG